jgi:hypothetical protein
LTVISTKEPIMKLTKFFATLFAALFLFAASALAGPPLVCHTYDIGNAKSLPWVAENWNLTGKETYDTSHLSADTLAILDTNSTVIVHMETLRRAALYGTKNPDALKQLLLKMIARKDAAAQNNTTAALAYFDLGYFTATLSQIHWISKDFANPAQSLDAKALIDKAIQLRGADPQMEFAAALVTLDGPASEHSAHAQKAIAGAGSDPLLARNLGAHFMNEHSETMTSLITQNPNVKVAQQ